MEDADAIARRDELVAVLTHELRSPLAALSSAAQILRMRSAGDEQSQWMVGLIGRQVDDLVRIVDAASEVSRITRGKITPAREPFALAAAVNAAIAEADDAVVRRQQRYVVEVPSTDVMVAGDRERFQNLVHALVASASRALPSGATLDVRATVEEDRAIVRVAEAGARATDEPASRGLGDVTLGFVLARELAALMGGSLRVGAPDPRYELSLPVR